MNDLMDRMDLIRGFELNPAATEGVSPMLLRQLAARGARHPYNTCATTRQKSAWGSSLPFY